MAKPRVFISHSAKEAQTQAFLLRLHDALAKEEGGERRYEVLLDQTELKTGDYWRSTLNVWIGGCDAAIALLSPGALASTYVAYELSILAYRKQFDPRFHLIPVMMGVDEKAVLESPLKPTQITEVQAVNPAKEDEWPADIERILAKLAAVARGKSPAEKVAIELARVLRKLDDEDVLREEAERLELELGSWIPQGEIALTLAFKLIGSGLAKAISTIMALRKRFPPGMQKDQVQLMVDLIASSWVDCKAAAAIPVVARENERRCLAVNASDELTAKMYVAVAGLLDSNRLPIDPWKIEAVSGIDGEIKDLEQVPPKLVRDVDGALRTALRISQSKDLAKEIDDHIAEEPLFVALPAAQVAPKWLDGLKKKFPGVTFFLLLGNEELKEETMHDQNIVVLDPPLAEGCEETFCSTYRQKLHHVMKDLPQ